MKYNMGTLGKVEVPEYLITVIKEDGEGCEGDCEKCPSFDNCLHEFTYQDRCDPERDGLFPEDVVDFMMLFHHKFWEPERIAFSKRIEVGEYGVVSFGILPEGDYSGHWEPYMIAYRQLPRSE